MIEPGYVRTMARYNAWQNKQLIGEVEAMPAKEFSRDRQGFFGSIRKTLNHLLWGDMLWMSRFDPSVDAPQVSGFDASTKLTPNAGVWIAARKRLDGQIQHWAGSLRNLDVKGDLHWYSGAAGRDVTKPLALCITHFLNHQTHHRGQVHHMLSDAGQTPPVSDLFLMPEDI